MEDINACSDNECKDSCTHLFEDLWGVAEGTAGIMSYMQAGTHMLRSASQYSNDQRKMIWNTMHDTTERLCKATIAIAHDDGLDCTVHIDNHCDSHPKTTPKATTVHTCTTQA